MTERSLIIIGGNAAGMSAAARAKRVNPHCQVTVFERGAYVSYAACGLPYLLSGEVRREEQLLARSVEAFAQQGVTVQLNHQVLGLEAGAKRVRVRDAAGHTREVGFDACLLATGATPRRLGLPGEDAANVFRLRNLADGLALRDALDRQRPRQVTLIGAGYLSLELAETLTRRGLLVTVVERADQVLPGLAPPLARQVEEALHRHGVSLRVGTELTAFKVTGDGRVGGVETTSMGWRTDLVVVGIGVTPNTGLATEAGLALDGAGGIRTDQRQETDRPGLYAAGDCTSAVHLLTGQRTYLPLATTANKQGRVAGENAAGGSARFPGVVGTAAVRVFDLEVARTGLSEAEAAAAGYDPVAVVIDASSRAGYYGDPTPMTVRLVADAASGRLLGGQLVGREGVVQRANVLAAALQSDQTVEQFATLDLAYAPPFAPVWDPLLVAANQLVKRL